MFNNKNKIKEMEGKLILLGERLKQLECPHNVNKLDFKIHDGYLLRYKKYCKECGKVIKFYCPEQRKEMLIDQNEIMLKKIKMNKEEISNK